MILPPEIFLPFITFIRILTGWIAVSERNLFRSGFSPPAFLPHFISSFNSAMQKSSDAYRQTEPLTRLTFFHQTIADSFRFIVWKHLTFAKNRFSPFFPFARSLESTRRNQQLQSDSVKSCAFSELIFLCLYSLSLSLPVFMFRKGSVYRK